MKIKIGKKGMMYLTGGAALAAIVAFSCGKVTESEVGPKKVETIGDDDQGNTDTPTPPVVSDGDCGDSSSISFCVATGSVDKYASGPSYEMTAIAAESSLDTATESAYAITSNLTKWHSLTANSNSDCAGTVTVSWNSSASKWVAMVPKANIAAVTSADCKLVVNANMGTAVSFAERQTLLGTKLNSTSVYSGASAPVSANSSACVNCHSRATSREDTPSGKFQMTAATNLETASCATDACRAALVDYTSLTDNTRRSDFRIGTTTSGSNCVTLTSTTGVTTGMYVSGTGITTGTTVAANTSCAGTNQIQMSANATATGTVQVAFKAGTGANGAAAFVTAASPIAAGATTITVANSTTGITAGQYVSVKYTDATLGTIYINAPGTTVTNWDGTGGVITLSSALLNTTTVTPSIAITAPVITDTLGYCAGSATCYPETYKRVDKGSPQTSIICHKASPVLTLSGGSYAATVDYSAMTGKPSAWPTTWPTSSGNYPRANAMPQSGPWFNTVADSNKLCRWILQGAPGT